MRSPDRLRFARLVLPLLAAAASALLACAAGPARADDTLPDPPSHARFTPAGAMGPIATGEVPVIDCTRGRCPELRIAGDAPATTPRGKPDRFRGFADASLREDPRTGRLWMAYSWPNVHRPERGVEVPGVDIHLASSDDGGRRWTFRGALWPSRPARDRGGRGEPGYLDEEVANLLPVVGSVPGGEAGARVQWYGVRLSYFVPRDGGYGRRPPSSFHLRIGRADSPPALAHAPTAVLGSARTDPAWGVDVDLAALAPEVGHCMLWNEPALYHEGGELFLALRCLAFDRSGAPRLDRSDLVVFATHARGPAPRWRWRYVGTLAGAREARELGGEGLTQLEIARGPGGGLLAILTPDAWSPRLGFVHHGCRVVAIASMDPPRLARDARGRLDLRGAVNASDQAPDGPGSCGYESASQTGVVLARRHKRRGRMTSSLHATGLHPAPDDAGLHGAR